MLDYVIDFVKVNGTTKPKAFKLKKLTLQTGETVTLTKKHQLKADATTFKLNPGIHAIALQINGIKLESVLFMVI